MRTRSTALSGVCRALDIAAVTALVAGCSAAGHTGTQRRPSALGTRSPQAVAPTPTSPSPLATATGPSSPADSTGATPPASSPLAAMNCTSAQLRIRQAGSTGAAGTEYVSFTITEATPTTCVLNGYVGARLRGAGGQALPTTLRRQPAPEPARVLLRPGGAASFTLSFSHIPTGTQSCPPAQSLQITPPDDTGHLDVPVTDLAPCGGVLTASAVTAGAYTEQ